MSPLIFHSAPVQMNKRPRRHLQHNNEIDGTAASTKARFPKCFKWYEYQQPRLYTITVSTVAYYSSFTAVIYIYVWVSGQDIHMHNKYCGHALLRNRDMNRNINFPLRILDVRTADVDAILLFLGSSCVRVRTGIGEVSFIFRTTSFSYITWFISGFSRENYSVSASSAYTVEHKQN